MKLWMTSFTPNSFYLFYFSKFFLHRIVDGIVMCASSLGSWSITFNKIMRHICLSVEDPARYDFIIYLHHLFLQFNVFFSHCVALCVKSVANTICKKEHSLGREKEKWCQTSIGWKGASARTSCVNIFSNFQPWSVPLQLRKKATWVMKVRRD